MELQIVLAILGAAGVVSAFLFALKGLLDQIPDVIRSWRRVVDEARRSRSDYGPEPEEHRPPSAGTDGSR
ncbi:hypothetical protein GCM10019016_016570 [Streptomyces prasinosporus]|uniref:Uncharacterized protein n=1 Tax=Streptomyces prasinosporus TaxID=68256 RepID=A0ABP6TH65_9ACTN